jgi:hypothetical protein
MTTHNKIELLKIRSHELVSLLGEAVASKHFNAAHAVLSEIEQVQADLTEARAQLLAEKVAA